ncbi:hypothetical protein [Streptomyces sp. H39-C1]|uniref:hypothetical protein n=1 Tax=Streptomyces sp. H39-C1 TaxID=3004355 RepID=UPI0022AF2E2F|nr:hypothetical protein [Streptomyces sp. H39-C1]MCZ4098101.1 hypothetical protein [Streptomyces sp. H39-C1]
MFPRAVENAAALLNSVFTALGDGCHTLTVSIRAHSTSDDYFVTTVPFCTTGERITVDQDETDRIVTLMLAGRIGGLVVRTATDNGHARVCGWYLQDNTAVPLSRAQIFNAYCTDPEGEPIPPEHGVEYAEAPPLNV